MLFRIGFPTAEVEGYLLYHSKPLYMIGVKVTEDEAVDAADVFPIQKPCDLCGRVYQQVEIMQKSRRTCPGIREALLSRFLTYSALTKRLGDR